MDTLPEPVIAQICLYLPQQDLAHLALTSRFLQPIATQALYLKVLVVLHATRPTKSVIADITRKVSGGESGSLVLCLEKASALLETLSLNEHLAALVKNFRFEDCEGNSQLELLQRAFLEVLKDQERTTSLKFGPLLDIDQTARNTSELERAIAACCTSVALDPQDFFTDIVIPVSHTFRYLHIQGFDALETLTCTEKIQVETFSISHLHGQGTASRLDFLSLERCIDTTSLSKIKLNIDCHELSCSCYQHFFQSFAEHVVHHCGLAKLRTVEVEGFAQEDWLRPVEMLERVLEPLSNFLKSLKGLSDLKLDFATPSLKITGEPAISDANKINRRLIDAFFLSMFETPDFGLRLRRLELPDFLSSFIYYKPSFQGSMLHSCMCEGCTALLSKIKEEVAPEIDTDEVEEVDDSQAMYLVLYGILRKLQHEGLISLSPRSPYSMSLLRTDKSDWLAEHFSSCTISEQDLKTYIVHQLIPMKDYFLGIFEKLHSLCLHGVMFERLTSNDLDMSSVFHAESYAPEKVNV